MRDNYWMRLTAIDTCWTLFIVLVTVLTGLSILKSPPSRSQSDGTLVDIRSHQPPRDMAEYKGETPPFPELEPNGKYINGS